MHVALGYNWFETSLGFHFERALRELGHAVTYVGLPSGTRAGFANVPVLEVLAGLAQPVDTARIASAESRLNALLEETQEIVSGSDQKHDQLLAEKLSLEAQVEQLREQAQALFSRSGCSASRR
jgi:hypothetical protein